MGPRGEHILVTGGAGFIGSHLAAALLESNTVTIYDSFANGNRAHIPPTARVIEGDICDHDQLASIVADVDRIYHEAAMVSVPQSVEAPLESHDVNLRATVALLEAARRHNVPVVLASSAAIYGQPNTLPITEDHRCQPSSPYGLEKLAIDQYARLYHEQYGLETVSLRYFNVYGPGQSGQYAGVISTFCDQAQRGQPLTIEGDGTQTRDFVHVSDVVQANLLAATSPAAVGNAINIGTGQSTTIASLAETIISTVDADIGTTHIDGRANDVAHSVADISRAREMLGFEPRTDLATGLQSLVSGSEVNRRVNRPH